MLEAAVAALSSHPVRIALTLPKNEAGREFNGALVTGYAPHTPILQQSAISVNQAGHGIVSKCLRYGVPMVLLPWDADQPGVAARAAALGVATVVPRQEVSIANVAQAVDELMNNPSFQSVASGVSDILGQRSPQAVGVSLIEGI